MYRLLIIFSIFSFCAAEVCYETFKVSPTRDFDMKRVTGKWYQLEETKNVANSDTVCIEATSTYENDNHLEMKFSQKNVKTDEHKQELMTFNPEKPDKGIFYNGSRPSYSPKHYYVILETDYDNYFIQLICSQNSVSDKLAIFARERELKPDQRKKVTEIIKQHKLDFIELVQVDQSNNTCNKGSMMTASIVLPVVAIILYVL